jgi:adenylate cyclase
MCILRPVSFMRTIVENLIARLAQVGADPQDDDETRLRKALLILISVLILPISLVWGTLYLAFGAQSGYMAYLYFAIVLGAIVIFARTRDVGFLLRVQLFDILFAPTLSMIPLGGFLASGGVGLWGVLAPLGALVFGGLRAGVRWYIAFLAVFLGSGIAGEALGITSPLPAWFRSTMLALNVVVGGTIVFTLLALFAKQRQDAVIALRSEQERAESLLLNILPRSIADRLKAQPEAIADQFTAASILFADVVDFTPRSEHLSPAEVVGVLNDLFSHFDSLAERHGLEKIKTIGDCYMVAAGVPSPRPDHARALALMALDMLQAMRTTEVMGDLGMELRVGINSGPVVAGVIGRKRFLYDLWGDAVNTASRMESHGTPGRIQITRATFELLKDEFQCEPRGTVSIKGKGDMETWYLVGPRQESRLAPLATKRITPSTSPPRSP